MLINAQPRAVLGFRAFTPQYRTVRREGLFQMANSDLNTLSGLQAAVSAGFSNEDWENPLGGLGQGNYSNSLATNVYNNSYDGLPSYECIPTPSSAPRSFGSQPQISRQQSVYTRKLVPTSSSNIQFSQPIEYWRSAAMPDWKMDYNHTLPDHLNRQCSYEHFAQLPLEVSSQPSFPMEMDYQPSDTLDFSSIGVHDSSDKEVWCSDFKQESGTYNHALPYSSSDGTNSTFPACHTASSLYWESGAAPLGTVSPKALTLSSSPSSSTASSFTGYDSESISDTVSKHDSHIFPTHYNNPLSAYADLEPEPLVQQSTTRHKLPSKPVHQSYVTILPSNDQNTAKPTKKRSSFKRDGIKHTAIAPRTAASDLAALDTLQSQTRKSSTAAKRKPAARRDSKDEFLIASKLAGMSYRDIRRAGGFKEAESTLRGRYRTLTKQKQERVRKPEWEEGDLKLLRTAVGKHAGSKSNSEGGAAGDGKGRKIPWKKIAEYIKANGGSYHFGNATCRKKWDMLMKAEAK